MRRSVAMYKVIQTKSELFQSGFDIIDRYGNVIIQTFECREWAENWLKENK